MAIDKMRESLPRASDENHREGIRVYWWHWLIGSSLILLLTWLAPRGKSPEFASLTEGSISRQKIIAPFDFEILKSQDELKRERNEAAGNVLPVMVIIDSVSLTNSRELLNFAGESEKVLTEFPQEIFDAISLGNTELSLSDSLALAKGSDKLFNVFGFRLASETWRFLILLFRNDSMGEDGLYLRFFEKSLGGILYDLYKQGIINISRDRLAHESGKVMVREKGVESPLKLAEMFNHVEALDQISFLLKERMEDAIPAEGAVSAAYEILQPFVAANVIYDEVETNLRRETAVAKVPLAKGFVKKDELVIGANIRVTRDHFDKLNSLAIKRAEMEKERGGLRALMPIGGHFIMVLLLVMLLGLFIANIRKDIWLQWKLILLTALILGLLHLFQALVPVKYDLPRYLFPSAVAAMLLAILVDRSVAIAGVVVLALLAGIFRGNDFPITFSTIAIGGTAIYAMRNVQTRVDVMRAGLYLTAVYIPIVTAFHFVRFTTGDALVTNLAIAGANAILSPTLALGFIIIFENLFRITTDLSLLELVDLNRPLLRELALKSPGTYHHSIMVGSLAETAARDIGANSLLTRAGAYYHDIGKMLNKDYYIENQEKGSQNIHDRLQPDRSAEVVIGHVYRGMELAEKHRLPPQVKAFISEHHGESRLAFFLEKAKLKIGESIDESKFHYPGPNPQSKETGILMLADTVEAATRSVENPSPDEIRDAVDRLIKSRLADGYLDECPLTLREIWQIKSAFIRVLTGIYHQRIPYPEPITDEVISNEDEQVKEELSGGN